MKYQRFLIPLFFITLAILLSACGEKELEDPLEWEIDNISGTTQSGEDFSIDDMEGDVWLANFIFTSCDTVCPPMTRNMSKVQDQLEEEGIDAEIVSFSVDPEIDTPEMLEEFASAQDADFSNWSFITGYSQEEIEEFAQESFRTIAQKPEGAEQVSHGSSFFLVDQNNQVMKHYKGDTDVPYEDIIEDTEILAE
ncbi:SCO1 protein [Halobacillus andaensis]|uniref:SCO1 protein n=1 Tax=Halobacillus andaensis TaxID=1176239 RepID=A0A917BCE5_HALAA|nr:SCO family protein [Halobacillus andaensis]MBP2006283.1 protein SCO1/2 [Halobacillus andaensis]GGF33984.1 SCO1 protein [Halobacillus andaensis]